MLGASLWSGSLCVLGVALAGCQPAHSVADLDPNATAKAAYEEALSAHLDRDWENSKLLMEEVKRKYATTRWARLAELRIADADYHLGKYAEAITAYRSFAQDYPNDPEVPYARYRISRSLYDQSGDSLLLPPQEERDLAPVADAYKELKEFLEDFPGNEHIPELKHMMAVVSGVLARHELYVARFYLGQSRFEAAINRCRFAIDEYPGSGLEPEALVLLGESYLRLDKTKEAKESFARVVRDHSASAFSVTARHFLEHIGTDRERQLRRP